MKIAIISDTHDNLANTQKAAKLIKEENIKKIIHCGDIFKPETIKEIHKFLKVEIHIIFSPADADFSKIPKDSFKNIKGIKIWKEFGEVFWGGKKIAFCHFPEIAEKLADSQKYDLVFYGHTHKPWESKTDKTRIVNPGNIAGLFYKPTFAVYDAENDNLKLKILEKL